MTPTKINVTKLQSASKKNYLLAVLTDKQGNPIPNVNVGFADDGVKYVTTDKDGKARYFIDHLKQGKHLIKVAFFGNDKYEASEKISYSFWIGKIPTKLSAKRDGNYIVAVLKDADNKPVSKVNVGFADNGVKYVATDKTGTARYSIAHFGYGTFTIKVAFWGNDTYNETGKIECRFTNERPKPAHRKYGHATEPCCDDRGQNTPYYCAPHSLQEVFRNLTDIVVPQSTIASWAGTTSGGTGHNGMDTAVTQFNRKYDKNLKTEWKHFSELGWDGIKNIVNSNNKDCIIHNLYRNSDGHYEVINNVGSDINVQNSLGSRCSHGCYYGYIEYRSRSEFQSYINGISQKSVMVVTNEG